MAAPNKTRVLEEAGAGDTHCQHCGLIMGMDEFVEHLPCTGREPVLDPEVEHFLRTGDPGTGPG